jgi:ribosomal protection tetracycline resistance protein
VSQQELNLGILAHVDAGKTTLTERLLYEAGVIDAVGSVDKGTTQTDSLALERQRGITIKTAVASFALGDVHVNLIDTPGHPDFIAEVERVLDVLDGAVLVISAVEGVQPQSRILMRALRRLEVPTVMFMNKTDRIGADPGRVFRAISDRLTASVIAMGTVGDLGTRAVSFAPYEKDDAKFQARLAEVLSEQDEKLLAAYVDGVEEVSFERLQKALAAQSRRGDVHAVFMGSAATGAGVAALMAAVPELLPSSAGDPSDSPSGKIFKIERGTKGEKIAYVRLFSGTVGVRDQLEVGDRGENKVKAIELFKEGSSAQSAAFAAGGVAKVWGLSDGRIGDRVGEGDSTRTAYQFAPPTLESVVAPRDPANRGRLLDALAQLAEQDPLINVRQNDVQDEISVSLYGEVQQEVIEATLATDYGLEVVFREATTICVERPLGSGEYGEVLYAKTKTNVTGKSSPLSSNPFPATLALRVEPAHPGSGIGFELDVDVRLLPLYIYKTIPMFQRQMAEYIREAMHEGLYGWEVTDCLVTLIDSGYRAPGTTAADFRKLTPLVLFAALDKAGTRVCEPNLRISLETPSSTTSSVLRALMALGAESPVPSQVGQMTTIEAALPAARFADLQHQLPSLSGGEGVVESTFDGYKPVQGEGPIRRRVTPSPLNRQQYLSWLSRRGEG